MEPVCVPEHSAPPGYPQVKQLCHLHTQLSLGQSCHRQKKKVCLCAQGHFSPVRLFVTLWTVACQASLSERGFSRQEYWSILVNTGCHTLLEHYISCCLSCKPPEYLVQPEPLRPKQLHHFYTWPSEGKPKSTRAASRTSPSG